MPSFLPSFSYFILSRRWNSVTWVDPIKRGGGLTYIFGAEGGGATFPLLNTFYLWKLVKGGRLQLCNPIWVYAGGQINVKMWFGLECKIGSLTCIFGSEGKISVETCFLVWYANLVRNILIFLEWEISAKTWISVLSNSSQNSFLLISSRTNNHMERRWKFIGFISTTRKL